MTAHDKDCILANIKARKSHYEIERLAEILLELEAEGLVDVWWDTQHKPIDVKLSNKGKAFIDNGGYSKLYKNRQRQKIRKSILSPLGRIIEAVVIAVLVLIAGWWLKESYGISDNPEFKEQNRCIEDSTFLSSASHRGLKEDSIASCTKSPPKSLDSSDSVRERCCTQMWEIDTSAVPLYSIKSSKSLRLANDM